ncbi:MAG: enamine deaminase RidA [Candidatus Rokuibacteriota bacterium]|nr:MAG: enamine deaminase RidA [Candidatus Rokubacteria bacterium]
MSRSSSRSSMIALSYVRSKPRRGLMKRQNIQPESLSKRVMGGHVLYSHVVVVEGRKTIFVAGQLARDRNGNAVGRGDMRAQIRQVGENIKAALAAAGASLSDIVKTNTYVTDIEEFFKHTDVRMEYFGALPTSTTVEVRRLAHPDLLVEVEVIAVVD